MATHSNVLAWEIPWIDEPGGLQSMESQKSWIWLSDLTVKQIYKIVSKDLLKSTKNYTQCFVMTYKAKISDLKIYIFIYIYI